MNYSISYKEKEEPRWVFSFRKKLTFVGAKSPTAYRCSNDSFSMLCMMEKVRADLRKIIHVYDYKDILEAFEATQSGETIKAVLTF